MVYRSVARMESLAYLFSTGLSIDWIFLLLFISATNVKTTLIALFSSFDDVDYIQQLQFITNSVPLSLFWEGAGNVSCAFSCVILVTISSFAHLNPISSIKPGYLQTKMLFKKYNDQIKWIFIYTASETSFYGSPNCNRSTFQNFPSSPFFTC